MHDATLAPPTAAPQQRKPRLRPGRERRPSDCLHVEPAAFDEAEAARYTNFARSTLRHWRLSGDGPPFIRVGRVIRYRRRDLDAWLDSKLQQTA